MAVGDAHVFPGFLTPVLTQLFFPNPPTTFLTCFCRGETPERKVASTGDRTRNHLVMRPMRLPLSHPGGAPFGKVYNLPFGKGLSQSVVALLLNLQNSGENKTKNIFENHL